MASKKATLLVVLLCFILILEINGDNESTVGTGKINCAGKCEYRCSKSSRHKMCIRACNTCCERCNCVPPGTSGNEDVCPCYANMKTHGGRHKSCNTCCERGNCVPPGTSGNEDVCPCYANMKTHGGTHKCP